MNRLKEAGNTDRFVRAMVFTGLAACAFLNVQDLAFSFIHLEEELISGCSTPMGHLGIDQLVHRTGYGTVTASHAEIGIHINTERE